jgi:MFS family permease
MPRTPVAPDLRRARWAVGALFLTNGALMANVVPRYPEIKAALDLPNATYGLAIAAFPAGAILAGVFAGAVVRRIGSAWTAVLGMSFAPSVALFALALLIGGACDAITDVAQNAHGLRVQREYRRSILNSFHALWSIGAATGGTMAAIAIATQLPLSVHLGISGVLFAVVALVALRFCLPGKDPSGADGSAPGTDCAADAGTAVRSGLTGHTVFTLVALVVIAIGGTLVEDSGNTWATLYLSRDLDAMSAIAATGYIALVGFQFVGRLIGDGLVDRFGQRAVARVGGLVIALGLGLALAFPTVPGTIAGFALAGLGSAPLVPAAMGEADALPGLKPGTGLTVVSWLMRLGFLLSPPLVGLVADAVSLRVGLLAVPIAGLAVVVLARVLPGRKELGSGLIRPA